MWPFDILRRAEPQQEDQSADVVDDVLLRALLGNGTVSKADAMNIPAFAACVNLISETIAMLPIRLYQVRDGEVEEVDDPRVSLLNDDTRDTMTGWEFKRAMMEDYLTGKGGYAYINRSGLTIQSLHYVREEQVTFYHNDDPIFKSYDIAVNGKRFRNYDFLKVIRNSRNGWKGTSAVDEYNQLLAAAYASQKLQLHLAKTGGNKKGYLSSTDRLTQKDMDALRAAWNRMYADGDENVIVLNKGVTFKESNGTSVEMQLNESIETMGKGICEVMGVPVGMLSGKPSDADREQFIQYCILLHVKALECALNRDLLLESEKGTLFFAADMSDLTKGDIEKRYKAYEIGVKNGFMQIDEVRFLEHRKPLGLNYVKLGLQDVLYDPKTNKFYVPNMNQSGSFGETQTVDPTGGGEQNESGNSQ